MLLTIAWINKTVIYFKYENLHKISEVRLKRILSTNSSKCERSGEDWALKKIYIYTPKQCKLSFFIRNIRLKFVYMPVMLWWWWWWRKNKIKRTNETLKLKLNLAIILCLAPPRRTDKMLKLYCLTFQNIFLFMRLPTHTHIHTQYPTISLL